MDKFSIKLLTLNNPNTCDGFNPTRSKLDKYSYI